MRFVRPLVNQCHRLFPRVLGLFFESFRLGQFDPPLSAHVQTMLEQLIGSIFFGEYDKVQNIFYRRQICIGEQHFAALRQTRQVVTVCQAREINKGLSSELAVVIQVVRVNVVQQILKRFGLLFGYDNLLLVTDTCISTNLS